MLLMAYVDMNKENEEALWFLDSGCSNHMCGKKEYFSDFDESFKDYVKLGNNSSMVVMGKGNVRLQVNGKAQIITRVFYVPQLKNNLLSLGQLQEMGLTILFQGPKDSSAEEVISLGIFNGNVQARRRKPIMLKLKKRCY
ncbi:hypothetical protein CsSME_00044899 [Camellia sinensis var. sinensis]